MVNMLESIDWTYRTGWVYHCICDCLYCNPDRGFIHSFSWGDLTLFEYCHSNGLFDYELVKYGCVIYSTDCKQDLYFFMNLYK